MLIADLQAFLHKLVHPLGRDRAGKGGTDTSTKATKEAITLNVPEGKVDLEDDDLLLSGVLEELLANPMTPEAQRRFSKSVGSSRVPSLDPISAGGGGDLLPMEGKEIMSGLGIDFETFGADWGDSSGEMLHHPFKHSLGVSNDLEVPSNINELDDGRLSNEHEATSSKKARTTRKTKIKVVFDEETQLGRHELLLAEGEGVLSSERIWDLDLIAMFPKVKNSTPRSSGKKTKRTSLEQVRGGLDEAMSNAAPDHFELLSSSLQAGSIRDGFDLNDGSMVGMDSPLLSRLARSLSMHPSTPPPLDGSWDVPSQIAVRRDSMDVLGIVSKLIGDRGSMRMNEMLGKGAKKAEVARCFYSLLDLSAIGAVTVEQAVPFGTIIVSKK